MKNGIITEEDKIYDIIKKYPELKNVLISINPIYKRLSNPIMLNSVAKITAVKEAAKIGKIYTKQLLLELNEAIGKREEFINITKKTLFKAESNILDKTFGNNSENRTKPNWLKKFKSAKILDYTKTDEEPFLKVTQLASTLTKNEGFILLQNFEPIPLINYLKSLGFEVFTNQKTENKYKIYFYKIKNGG